jgi:hypothetical protein
MFIGSVAALFAARAAFNSAFRLALVTAVWSSALAIVTSAIGAVDGVMLEVVDDFFAFFLAIFFFFFGPFVLRADLPPLDACLGDVPLPLVAFEDAARRRFRGLVIV